MLRSIRFALISTFFVGLSTPLLQAGDLKSFRMPFGQFHGLSQIHADTSLETPKFVYLMPYPQPRSSWLPSASTFSNALSMNNLKNVAIIAGIAGAGYVAYKWWNTDKVKDLITKATKTTTDFIDTKTESLKTWITAKVVKELKEIQIQQNALKAEVTDEFAKNTQRLAENTQRLEELKAQLEELKKELTNKMTQNHTEVMNKISEVLTQMSTLIAAITNK